LLIGLPILTALWVNLHIYFIMGIFIIGVYTAGALFELLVYSRKGVIVEKMPRLLPLMNSPDKTAARRTAVVLLFTLLASGAAALINPNGFNGATEPFFIFREYGYLLVENQSLWFLHRVLPLAHLGLFEAMAAFVWIVTIFALRRAWLRGERIDMAAHVIALTFTCMGALALRNFTLMGLYTAPILASSLRQLRPSFGQTSTKKSKKKPISAWMPLVAAVSSLVVIVCWHAGLWQKRWEGSSISLLPGGPGAIEFFLKEGLHGPIFNNYDIGGLLILGLFPRERVFVDNRPEAYPASFFQDLYIPVQEDAGRWQEARRRFGFNAIVFGYRDLTPWGQKFLAARLDDSAWAPVYADLSTLIFVPDDEKHRDLIAKYRLPRTMFNRQ
jgi:hypothetical protein